MPRPLAFLVLASLALCACATTADDSPKASPSATPVRLLSQELIEEETAARGLPPERQALLARILADAVAAVGDVATPRTRDEALAVLDVIQTSITKHNLIQPRSQANWPQTMGDALRPIHLNAQDRRSELGFYQNRRRAPHVSESGPLFYVDCDIGAQIFVSLGQHFGWDIRLVEVPNHNFVRWHLQGLPPVNWDWSDWSSEADDSYEPRIPSDASNEARQFYLQSQTLEQTRAYYKGLIASKTDNADIAERLFSESVADYPGHPLTTNNRAWFYATHADVSESKRRLALGYALAAWALRPDSGNYADTVACSMAASGYWDLALATESHAMTLDPGFGIPEAMRSNHARIANKQLCAP